MARHPNPRLVEGLRSRFPAEAAQTDQWLRERDWNRTAHDLSFIWIEAFADRTMEAIRRRDSEVVQSHTNFIAGAYRAEPEALRTIVDVAYAENIMWDVGRVTKRCGRSWPESSLMVERQEQLRTIFAWLTMD